MKSDRNVQILFAGTFVALVPFIVAATMNASFVAFAVAALCVVVSVASIPLLLGRAKKFGSAAMMGPGLAIVFPFATVLVVVGFLVVKLSTCHAPGADAREIGAPMIGGRTGFLIVLGILAFVVLTAVWMVLGFRRSVRSDAAYFDPAIALSDRALRALAVRLGGTFRPGATTWMSYTYGFGRFGNLDFDKDIAGAGSHVGLKVGNLDVDVNSSVEQPNDKFVLVPRVLITLGPGTKWRMSTSQLSYRGLWHSNSTSSFDNHVPPPGAEQVYGRLAERSYKFSVATSYLDVRGELRHATFDTSGERGRVDFDVDGLVDLVERACAFTLAATSTDPSAGAAP